MVDVAVLGAGLAGLSAGRDLVAAGADAVVLEARDRVGGRVEALQLADGRVVQGGGEVVGAAHGAYLALADELGMELEPSYVADPGEMTWGLDEGVFTGDRAPWMSAAERADLERVEALFAGLAATVDPDDPWAHPEFARLDRLSLGGWLRSVGATPAVRRRYALSFLSLSCDAPERTSLLAELRKHATLSGDGFYDLAAWEGLRAVEGSAALAARMAEGLGDRVRLGAVVESVSIGPSGARVGLRDGEVIEAEAVVCALPAGPLRAVRIEGVSEERVRSLRALRQALAAKVVVAYDAPFWQRAGQNGLAETEWLFGSTWPQGVPGVLSLLVPPERLSAFVAAPETVRRDAVVEGLVALYGSPAAAPSAYAERLWGADPFTRGYITSWAPGDLGRAGPLHGSHEPPFYVAGSDHWVAGYMEGAVRTGRGAARAALGAGSRA
jgi:monoamine oxidase